MKRIMFLAVVAVVAFAGVAYAAASITGAQIKNSTITGKDVKNKSLTAKDFKGSVRGAPGAPGARGPVGGTGPQGPAGPQGPPGPSALSAITIQARSVTVAPGAVDGVIIPCPAGQRTVSGGYFSDSVDGEVFTSVASDDRTEWIVALDNVDSLVTGDLTGEAYCAGAGQAVAASPRSRARAKAKLARLVAQRKAAHH